MIDLINLAFYLFTYGYLDWHVFALHIIAP